MHPYRRTIGLLEDARESLMELSNKADKKRDLVALRMGNEEELPFKLFVSPTKFPRTCYELRVLERSVNGVECTPRVHDVS